MNSNPVILMYVHRDEHMHFYVCFLRFQAFMLRGVPLQCGDRCKVYAVNSFDEKILLGEIAVKFCAASDRVMTAFCLLLCAIIGKSWLTSLH